MDAIKALWHGNIIPQGIIYRNLHIFAKEEISALDTLERELISLYVARIEIDDASDKITML